MIKTKSVDRKGRPGKKRAAPDGKPSASRSRQLRKNITVPREQIAAFCKHNHIRKLAFFGSVLRDDFRLDSDVDVLVEFEPGHVPGFGFMRLQRELSAVLGRKVDLNTPNSLSRYFRDQVLAEAEVTYAQE